jgi:hypothetical protein
MPGQAEGKSCHIETGGRVFGVHPHLKKAVVIQSKGWPIGMKMSLHQVKGENIVPGRDRGVGGKNRRTPDSLNGLVPMHTSLDTVPDPFQKGEGRMSFV